MVKRRTMSQVVYWVFTPLSCISVSVQGPWSSGELCRNWFFKSSYHFHTYRYPFKARGHAANRVASGSSSVQTTFIRINIRSKPIAKQQTVMQVVLQSLYTTFMRIGIRSRPIAKQRTLSQVVLQTFIPLSCVSISVLGHGEPCRKGFFKWLLNLHKQQYKPNNAPQPTQATIQAQRKKGSRY